MRFYGGRMFNDWRGDGWYCSVTAWPRHLLLAFRPHPRDWRLAWVKPDAKPDYRRLYIGPLEIEVS